uniref:Protein kinase domain-containing protein n=1 Tax=Parastrongyloides trichosuri TaxID=131310 RepID=A0A0N4ZEV5_PARTI
MEIPSVQRSRGFKRTPLNETTSFNEKKKVMTPLKNVSSSKKDLSYKSENKLEQTLQSCNTKKSKPSPSSTSMIFNPLVIKRNKEKMFVYSADRKETISTSMRLDEQHYYHGLLPRKYIGNRFKNPGDFLILLKFKSGEPHYFIELLDGDVVVKRISISKENDLYFLSIPYPEDEEVRKFTAIPLLINYYHRHQIPGYICLKYPIPRPNTFYCHHQIKYNRNGPCIGKGTFSTIFKGKVLEGLYRGIPAAVKVPDNGKTEQDKDYIKIIKKTSKVIIKEASIMEELDDMHVLNFYGLCLDNLPVALIMELCEYGSLEEHLIKEGNNICTGELLYYCYDIAKGMRYLSKLQIVHRNLSASNVLIGNNGYLKIGGFSKACKLDNFEPADTLLLLRYMPPEGLSKRSLFFSETSDVWSYGVTIIEIFNNGVLPLKELNDEEFKERILQNCFYPIPSKCPETLSFGIQKGIFIMPPCNRFTFRHIQELLEVILKRTDLYPPPRPRESAFAKKGIQRIFSL